MRIEDVAKKTAEQVETPRDGNEGTSFNAGLYGIYGDLETQMSTAQDSRQLMTSMMDSGADAIRDLATRGVEVRSDVILSNENGTSVLAFDTIVIAMRFGENVAVATVIMKDNVVLQKEEVAVVQYDANLNPTQYEDIVQVNRFPSEADDSVFRDIITNHVATMFTDQQTLKVQLLHPKVWYPTVLEAAEDSYLHTELKHMLQNMVQRLAPSWSSPSSARVISKMYTSPMCGLDVTLGGYHGDAATTFKDELGRLSVPTASVGVRLMTQGTNTGTTLHRGGRTIDIGTVGIRTEVMWVGSPFLPPGAQPAFISPGAPNIQGFAPNVIIEDVEAKSPRLEDVLLTLGVTYIMMNEQVVKSSFDPTTLGVLNISTNLLGDASPAPLAPKAMKAEFDTIYGQMMRPGAVGFSMVLRPGSHGINTTGFLNNKDANNELILRQALDNMTENAFSASFNGSILLSGEPEPYLVGTYPAEDGSIRPLSEIGLQQIMVVGNQNREAIRYWIDSQSPDADRKTSIALKLKALEICGIAYTLDEVYTLVSLNTAVLSWLGEYIKAKNLIQSSNINQFGNAAAAGWGTNRLAGHLGNYYGHTGQGNQGYGQPMQVVSTPNGPMYQDPSTGAFYPMGGGAPMGMPAGPAPSK